MGYLKYKPGQVVVAYHYRDKSQRYTGVVSSADSEIVKVDVPAAPTWMKRDNLTFHASTGIQVDEEGIDGWGQSVWRLGTIDRWIDLVYDEIDDLCLDGKFDKVDAVLDKVDVETYPLSILIGYLTISLPFIKEGHIKNTGHVSEARENLFFKILEKLMNSNESDTRIGRLLGGLGLEYYSNKNKENG
jgi:hypothetical protein